MPQVFFSSEDLSGGLVGYSCYGLHGYGPVSAFQLLRNAVLTRAKSVPAPRR